MTESNQEQGFLKHVVDSFGVPRTIVSSVVIVISALLLLPRACQRTTLDIDSKPDTPTQQEEPPKNDTYSAEKANNINVDTILNFSTAVHEHTTFTIPKNDIETLEVFFKEMELLDDKESLEDIINDNPQRLNYIIETLKKYIVTTPSKKTIDASALYHPKPLQLTIA